MRFVPPEALLRLHGVHWFEMTPVPSQYLRAASVVHERRNTRDTVHIHRMLSFFSCHPLVRSSFRVPDYEHPPSAHLPVSGGTCQR